MRATEIVISGRLVTADGAHSRGTVDQVARERADAPLPTALSLEQDATAWPIASEDAREGVAPFIEKRQPQFRGEGR
jgi:enoyl-CoA hydratase/carnithine racemase